MSIWSDLYNRGLNAARTVGRTAQQALPYVAPVTLAIPQVRRQFMNSTPVNQTLNRYRYQPPQSQTRNQADQYMTQPHDPITNVKKMGAAQEYGLTPEAIRDFMRVPTRYYNNPYSRYEPTAEFGGNEIVMSGPILNPKAWGKFGSERGILMHEYLHNVSQNRLSPSQRSSFQNAIMPRRNNFNTEQQWRMFNTDPEYMEPYSYLGAQYGVPDDLLSYYLQMGITNPRRRR